MKVRTRFAPSPTGYLHIGSLRTALFCYALAKKQNGDFIVRVEDTDRTRFVEGSIDTIFEMLTAYGLEPDESLKHGGDYGPYIQSERLDLYKEIAEKLVKSGDAYYCFLTKEESEVIKKELGQGVPFRSPHRDLTEEEIKDYLEKEVPYVIRQKMPESHEIKFIDELQGELKFNTDDVDEGILLKSDGFPTYHLAVVVDDHAMEITHVFRGQEWISSIPKHALLYEALGYEIPKFYHLPLILDPAGGKLSKRKGAVSAEEFLRMGVLPEAMLNQLMLLGWSPPLEREHGETERELFTLEEFIEIFDPKDLNYTNAVFNQEKLIWFNKQYFMNLTDEKLAKQLLNWAGNYAEDTELGESIISDGQQEVLEKKVVLLKERSRTLSEMAEGMRFFWKKPEEIDWEVKQLKKVKNLIEDIVPEIRSLFDEFPENSEEWDHEEWEMGMRAIGDKYEVKHGDVFMILRVAIVGTPVSPPLLESLQILGKEEVISRLDY